METALLRQPIEVRHQTLRGEPLREPGIGPVEPDYDQALDLRSRAPAPHEDADDRLDGPDQDDPEGHHEGTEQDEHAARCGETCPGPDVGRSGHREQSDDDRGEDGRTEDPLQDGHGTGGRVARRQGGERPVYRPRRGSAGAPGTGRHVYGLHMERVGPPSNRRPLARLLPPGSSRGSGHACAGGPGSSRPTPRSSLWTCRP
jgi:hypothetical protein